MLNTSSGSYSPGEEIPQGTPVYDIQGDKVGRVTFSALRDGYFVVEQGWLFTHELFLPHPALLARAAKGVTLRLSKEELKQERWKQPPSESASGAPTQPGVPPNFAGTGSNSNEDNVIHLPPPEEEPPSVHR